MHLLLYRQGSTYGGVVYQMMHIEGDIDSASGSVVLQDLTYSVKSHHDKKVTLNLLSSVSGFFNSGEMSALVWPLCLRDLLKSCLPSSLGNAHFIYTPEVELSCMGILHGNLIGLTGSTACEPRPAQVLYVYSII